MSIASAMCWCNETGVTAWVKGGKSQGKLTPSRGRAPVRGQRSCTKEDIFVGLLGTHKSEAGVGRGGASEVLPPKETQ